MKIPLLLSFASLFDHLKKNLLQMHAVVTQGDYEGTDFCRGVIFGHRGTDMLWKIGHQALNDDAIYEDLNSKQALFEYNGAVPTPRPGNKF